MTAPAPPDRHSKWGTSAVQPLAEMAHSVEPPDAVHHQTRLLEFSAHRRRGVVVQQFYCLCSNQPLEDAIGWPGAVPLARSLRDAHGAAASCQEEVAGSLPSGACGGGVGHLVWSDYRI